MTMYPSRFGSLGLSATPCDSIEKASILHKYNYLAYCVAKICLVHHQFEFPGPHLQGQHMTQQILEGDFTDRTTALQAASSYQRGMPRFV
jgi:hypothetical protein